MRMCLGSKLKALLLSMVYISVHRARLFYSVLMNGLREVGEQNGSGVLCPEIVLCRGVWDKGINFVQNQALQIF